MDDGSGAEGHAGGLPEPAAEAAERGGSGAPALLPPRIAVVGAGRATPREVALAEAVGQALGEAGAVVITGGLGGVMEAASRGCARGGGLPIGILPGRDAEDANPWVRVPLPTGMGEVRNALVAGVAEAVVAVGGEWGTLSEIALARKRGIGVILLGDPPADLPLPRAADAGAAAAWALREVEVRRGRGSA